MPAPEDLVAPFETIVARYNMTGIVDFIGPLLDDVAGWLGMPTMYALKLATEDWLTAEMIYPVGGNNYEIYDAVRRKLDRDDVLLGSEVVSATRSQDQDQDQVRLVVKTSCTTRHIRARNIIIAIPPSPRSLEGLALDKKELSLVEQFNYSALYTAAVRVKGLPVTIRNKRADTPYGQLELPALVSLNLRDSPDMAVAHYVSSAPMAEADVRKRIVDDILRLRMAGFNVSQPEILAFASHSPHEARVSSELIRGGFYARLNDLQGYRNTWWIGAAFQGHDSAQIWRLTRDLIEKHILKRLG
ncbi:hypothetical protein FE257_004567 [Aspergillus nanangensis]|uniref:Amine oxidase domain-containing protein n=1 Tax=Aspergillus nanangensis TaxID=2582783 RepID=A0AAD4CY94_ASPNN|nr:hypothetical protein FE257_004567 [Aspergillus nanangensis]